MYFPYKSLLWWFVIAAVLLAVYVLSRVEVRKSIYLNFTRARLFIAGTNGEVLNLKQFAKGDGITNDTESIRYAFFYAKKMGYKEIYAPQGKYLIDANLWEKAITLDEGLTLRGDGYSTEFAINPGSIKSYSNNRLFLVKSNTIVKYIRINGQKNLIDAAKLQDCDVVGVIGKNENQSNYSFQNIWVHDLIGVDRESFGVMTSNGSTAVKFKNIIGWNVQGTPIHVAGDYLNNNLTSNVTVEDCTTYNNGWQGISVYGASKVTINRHSAYQNLSHGINLEWCKEVLVTNSAAYANSEAGVGSHGKASFVVANSTIYNNNTVGEYGEISLRKGTWYKGNPAPTAVAGIVEIRNCLVKPRPQQPHIFVSVNSSVNVGSKYPNEVSIVKSGGQEWTVKLGISDNGTREKIVQVPLTNKTVLNINEWLRD